MTNPNKQSWVGDAPPVLADNSRARRLTNLENAMLFIKIGLYVFVSSGKTPLIPRFNKIDTQLTKEEREMATEEYEAKHDGKKPVHVGATKNLAVIKKMFRAYPDAVPSIACGPSKIVVIDADLKDNGPELIGAHFAEHGLPEGVVVIPTQSGGQHFIFRDPDGKFTNRAGVLKKKYGCDVRGARGQYVAPGSIREDGKTYGTKKDMLNFVRAYTRGTLPDLPDHITALIGEKPEGTNKDVTDAEIAHVIKDLEQNDWPDYDTVFEPALDGYDLEALKQANPAFAELYDNPTGNHSDDRWAIAQMLLREYRMSVEHLAVFFEKWKGSGELTRTGEGTGNYDLRAIAREWYKNKDLYRSMGDAFRPVTEDPEDSEYEKLTTSNKLRKRVPIDVNLNDPQAMLDKVEDVLLKEGAEIYRRGDRLVEVVTDKPLPGLNSIMPTAQLLPVNAERLAQVTGSVIDFRRYDKRQEAYRSCPPPRDLMHHMMARGVRSKLRRINFLATTPMMRPDGSILATPGYDPATEVYLVPGFDLPSIPECPTQEEGLKALQFAEKLFSECAFADKGPGYPFTSVGLSAALSVVVAGVARLLMSGIPMLTSTAATPGSGKSFIGTLIGIWLTGREIPVSNVAVGSAGELDKRLTAGLLGGAPMIHLDNCNGKLDSELLCQILTERSVAVRPLGVSEEVTLSGMPLVLANGNNVQVDENLARRTLLVELDARMEKPELRHFHLRPDYLLRENRGAYVAAILTALRAYLLALKRGDAKPIAPAVGSFDGWSDYSRSLMVWYGYRDPVEAMAIAQAEDPEKAARGAIFKGLHVLFGDRPFTASEVVQRIEAAEYDVLDERPAESGVCAQVQENLRILLPKHNRTPSTQSLGTLFRNWATKVEMGLTFKRLERNAANVTTYAIVPIGVA